MANNNLANVPNFYKGTYANLVKALEPGGIFANQNKAALAYVTDKKCLAIIDANRDIVLVGDTSGTMSGITGSVADPVVLDELDPGIYSVSGSYRMSATEPVISSSANQLFVVGENHRVSQMKADGMTRQDYDAVTGAITESEYMTDADIEKSFADSQDIANLFS